MEIALLFLKQTNRSHIFSQIKKSFPNFSDEDELKRKMEKFVFGLSDTFQSLSNSTPLHYENIIADLNREFLKVYFNTPSMAADTQNKTSLRRNMHQSANDTLESWRTKRTHGRKNQMREDFQAANGLPDSINYAYSALPPVELARERYGFDRQHIEGIEMRPNVNYHEEQFYTPAMMEFNSLTDRYTATPVGVSTPEADARLLERRIFRADEDGVENGIPTYRTWMHNRHPERDINENLTATEYIGHNHKKYDMTRLHAAADRHLRLKKNKF